MELSVWLRPGDTIGEVLTRAGAPSSEAARAQALMTAALPRGIAPRAEIGIGLGPRNGTGERPLLQLTLRADLGLKLAVTRERTGELVLKRENISVDATPLRFRGRSGAGLYWSMRARGVPPAAAAEFSKVVATRLEKNGQLAPEDQFDLVMAHRRASTGESQIGPLLYAGIDRKHGSAIKLVNGTIVGRPGWFDADSGVGDAAGLTWPVTGRISSRYGTRFHPILRFARFHSGVDVSAAWGSPIVAAADGQVTGAGWNGGHGRQVRIVHSGGLQTSYSHMSRIVAYPGSRVRQGQLIGYVGSTGFSTGPHLHYEIHESGRAVDPLRARHSVGNALGGGELAAIRTRLRQLLAIDGSRLASAVATSQSS